MTSRPPLPRSLVITPAALALGALALMATWSLAGAQQPQDGSERNGARLSNLMQSAQVGHTKLWFAGKARNWELAAYETRQLRLRLEDAALLYQSLPVNDVTTMVKPLDAVAAAISAKDTRQFTRAYADLTAGCNSCHHSVKIGYITLQQPTSNPFGDQNFAPPKK